MHLGGFTIEIMLRCTAVCTSNLGFSVVSYLQLTGVRIAVGNRLETEKG